MSDAILKAFLAAADKAENTGELFDERGGRNRNFQLNENLSLSGKTATFKPKGMGRKSKEVPVDPNAREESQVLGSYLHNAPSMQSVETGLDTGDHAIESPTVEIVGTLAKQAGIVTETSIAYAGYSSPQEATGASPEKPKRGKKPANVDAVKV